MVGGSSLPAVRVDVNPTQLNATGLGLEDVRNMLSQQNANLAKGQIANDSTTSDLASNDQLLKAEYYRPLIVGFNNGAAIRLSDIATVQDSVENIRSAGVANGKPCALIIIFREPGANIIDTVDGVSAALPQLKAAIPTAIDLTVVMDQTTTIRASVTDVERTLLISIVLVILVVFLFLRNPRSYIHSRRGGSGLLNRHVWRDVFVRLQSRQPVVDGSNDFDRLRCRRRDRGY